MSEEDNSPRSSLDVNANHCANPKLIIVFSGKRKSGKDHISNLIANYIGAERKNRLAILRIAGPIKKEFARAHKLDFDRLLDSSSYKEDYRLLMVEWSEKYREQAGWNIFLEAAIKEQEANLKSIWILNDARRPCDIEFFENDSSFENARLIKLRIEASDEVRASRGWKFVDGIDNKNTECGLDNYNQWTFIINNECSNDEQQSLLLKKLEPTFREVDKVLGSSSSGDSNLK